MFDIIDGELLKMGFQKRTGGKEEEKECLKPNNF